MKLIILLMIFLVSPALWARGKCFLLVDGDRRSNTGRFTKEECRKQCQSRFNSIYDDTGGRQIESVSCQLAYSFSLACSFVHKNRFTKIFRASICDKPISTLDLSGN